MQNHHTTKEKNIKTFCQDIKKNKGYLYTQTNKLSCKIANLKQSESIHSICGNLAGKSIIDVGCGDGTYTFEFLKYKPKYILGVDPAKDAISIAKSRYEKFHPNIKFITTNIYKLNTLGKHFDIAIVRGVLHHLYQTEKAIQQLSQIADIVIILEPNGYNFILKIIEKVSPYHRQHEEKSYRPALIDKWVLINKGKIVHRSYFGLVPYFCPSVLVKILKVIEPIVEQTPVLNHLFASVYLCKCDFSHSIRKQTKT